MKYLILVASLFVSSAIAGDVVNPHDFMDVKTKTVMTMTNVVKELNTHRFVLLGEKHDDPRHHAWQLAMLNGIHKKDVVLAIEMLTWDHIDTVNLWLEDKISNEQLEMVWDSVWGYDFTMYKPILEHAKANGWGIAPMRVDDVTKEQIKVYGSESVGLLKPNPPTIEYIQMLKWVFDSMHGSHSGEFSDFAGQQVIWDSTMAQTMMGLHKDTTVVAIVGGGHLENGWGIPHQLKGYGFTDILSLIPVPGPFTANEVPDNYADILYRSE